MTPVGAQEAYTTKSQTEKDCEEDEAVEAEKTVADRIRQHRDSRDPHTRGFLKAFYAARALERSKRAS